MEISIPAVSVENQGSILNLSADCQDQLNLTSNAGGLLEPPIYGSGIDDRRSYWWYDMSINRSVSIAIRIS